jgi:hypothetical protein
MFSMNKGFLLRGPVRIHEKFTKQIMYIYIW